MDKKLYNLEEGNMNIVDRMYFTGFGYLKYIESESVKIGKGKPWHYVCREEGIDDNTYDIVQCDGDTQFYYTII